MPPLVEMKHITKLFPGVVANAEVSLEVEAGEVHALLGENGAGKTTIMNILYGMYHATSGSISVRGEPVTIHSSRDAIALGIGMVHQHFMLVPTMTVGKTLCLACARSGSSRT